MSDYTLLTGATGLLGRYLLRDLLRAGERLAVIVRSSKKATARQRIETIMQRWEQEDGCLYSRPVVFEGDITQPLLGLSPDAIRWIGDYCSSCIHSAATLTFETDSNNEPWRTNIGGTEELLKLCEQASVLQLHYVSTAYVCGLREGTVLETELDCGQEFRNDYEQSKVRAETLVRQAEFLDRLTVYRPTVISGDSVNGYTNTYHGLYLYLKLMSVLVWNTPPDEDGVRHTPARLDMTGEERRNVVPVDWVSDLICRLFRNSESHGHTFHLAPSEPVTPREIIEAGYKYFNSTGVEFSRSQERSHDPISQFDQDVNDNITIYRSYDVSDPHFDMTNLETFLPGMPSPRIDQEMLHRYWRYGEGDRWGKRREKEAELLPDLSVELQQTLCDRAQSLPDDSALGLDIRGPGGGQWSLTSRDGRLVLEEGVLPECGTILNVSREELARHLSGCSNGHTFVHLWELAKSQPAAVVAS